MDPATVQYELNEEDVSFHEAGHVFLHDLLGIPLMDVAVSIIPTNEHLGVTYSGDCLQKGDEYSFEDEDDPEPYTRVEKWAQMFLAGEMAQFVHNPAGIYAATVIEDGDREAFINAATMNHHSGHVFHDGRQPAQQPGLALLGLRAAPTYLAVRCSTIGRSRPLRDNLNKQDSVTSSRGSGTFWCISSQTREGNALSTLFVEPKL